MPTPNDDLDDQYPDATARRERIRFPVGSFKAATKAKKQTEASQRASRRHRKAKGSIANRRIKRWL